MHRFNLHNIKERVILKDFMYYNIAYLFEKGGLKLMHRMDKAISEDKARSILEKAQYGILSTVSRNAKPYGVPLHFCILDEYIYFHSAMKGYKIDNIEHNNSVSFCVVDNVEILPDKFSTKYESVIVFGKVKEVFDKEKQLTLEELLRKYSYDFFQDGLEYIRNLNNKTRVFKISIDKIAGKKAI